MDILILFIELDAKLQIKSIQNTHKLSSSVRSTETKTFQEQMQLQAHMGHGTMSNCVEETAAGGGKIAISLAGNDGALGNGGGQMQMQANGVIVAIKSNGNNGVITTGNDCTKTSIDLNNGSNGNMGGVTNKDNEGKTQVEVGVKHVSSSGGVKSGGSNCSNGVKSVSALLNGMQLSYQAKAVGAVLTGKVTAYNLIDENNNQIRNGCKP